MILEYDGVVVDFFEKFPAHWKNIEFTFQAELIPP